MKLKLLKDDASSDIDNKDTFSYLKCNSKIYGKLLEHADGRSIVWYPSYGALVILGRLVDVDDSLGDDEIKLCTEIKPEPEDDSSHAYFKAENRDKAVARMDLQ